MYLYTRLILGLQEWLLAPQSIDQIIISKDYEITILDKNIL